MSQIESNTSRRTKTRFENRFAKGESRACKRAKTRFKSKFAKGESRACRRAKLGSKMNLQKVKIEHVKEGILNIRHTS
jgi:hypothetical protein